MWLESLANRVCLLQCDALSVLGDEQCNLDALSFAFMLWDHTAHAVRIGCVQSDGSLLFIVSYDSPTNGKRLFMGAPWVVRGDARCMASTDAVNGFLRDAGCVKQLKADVVFDGDLAVDKTVSLHLRFDCNHHDGSINDGDALLIKDVACCENVLLVIDMFE
jgi:hypothetical protein